MNVLALICFAIVPVAVGDGAIFRINVKGQPTFCLDAYGGKAANGNLIDIWTCDPGAKGQQWYFDTGTFKIRSVLDESKCLDAGDMKQGRQLKLWDCGVSDNQFWTFDTKSNNIVLVSTAQNGIPMCLDVKDATYKNGNPVQVWPCDKLPNQVWAIGGVPHPLKITIAGKNSCLDLYSQKTDNGTPIDIWGCTDGVKGQQWYWEDSKIKSAVDSQKCIDAGGSMNMHDKLQLWDCADVPQQKWGWDQTKGAIYLGTDPKNQKLCMCLTTWVGTDPNNGGHIQLFSCYGAATEKWERSVIPSLLTFESNVTSVMV